MSTPNFYPSHVHHLPAEWLAFRDIPSATCLSMCYKCQLEKIQIFATRFRLHLRAFNLAYGRPRDISSSVCLRRRADECATNRLCFVERWRMLPHPRFVVLFAEASFVVSARYAALLIHNIPYYQEHATRELLPTFIQKSDLALARGLPSRCSCLV